ncbi:phosphoesterase PA-phosphatase related [Catenulispora acidiphila DSM 44928]|uniref:Phosphoesterase PA-phosphatase related n=1 Tax=Catenulispora acidiphila (strain DSM 44928 / JCM 14897 / NBRC 102108 / NRRL B-24433 / ID139908) TaxID=479433 RepID=C7Q5L9_CATAD|nr:phosphatase PAP2 family protein [Catenulispora acidiphila]ACU77830.1 phosphoesterase PA-phosphatase related [Catenulispora acidiphila DSM 44928]
MPKVRHWLVIAVALFAAALAVGLTAAHTSLTRSTELSWDGHIQELRTGWLNRAMLDLANLASPVGGLAIIVLITLFFLWRRNPVQACATFLVIAVGWNSSEIAKIIVARHRPPVLYSLAPETGSNSFPSGHTSFAFSLAVAVCLLAARTRWFGLTVVLATLWTLLVAFSRLYIGAHYPLDVLGSFLVSSSAIVFVLGLWHVWIAPNLYRVPLLDRFGPVPGPASVPETASVA